MKLVLSLVIISLVAFACSKHDATTSTPAPPPISDFEVDNMWRCEVNGKLYQGRIDTSFYILDTADLPRRDTNIYIIGSTADGRADITMKMRFNRNAKDWVLMGVGGDFMTFDTASTNVMTTVEGIVEIPFKTEGFTGKKLRGTFAGSLRSLNDRNEAVTNAITNGAISVELGKGSGAPKFMSVAVAGNNVTGPIRSAVHRSNALIIDGVSFGGDTTYQVQVRTGAAIKPGSYRSSNGDVGFQLWRPSFFTHYVSDSLGDLSVTIQSVEGNIVTGTINGTTFVTGSGGTAAVTSGQFKCRVKDYFAGVDGNNQWGFSMDNKGQPSYVTAGGNITDATIRQNGARYVLTLKGTSDNGSSAFSLTLASFQPIAPGTYPISSWTDSCYLSTPSVKYFNDNDKAYIRIDTLSSTRLVGAFYGNFLRGSLLYGGGLTQTLRKGFFRTEGHF